jgi:hypothetical protein
MSARLLCVVLLSAPVSAGSVAAQEGGEPLKVTGGETALEFNRHVLSDLGIAVALPKPVGEAGEFARAIFRIQSPASLRIHAPGGSFNGFAEGVLRHEGGFELSWKGGRQQVLEFTLAPAAEPALFELQAADGSTPFFLDSPHPQHLPAAGEFVFLNLDLRLADGFARRLGRPEIGGAAVGSAGVRARLDTPLEASTAGVTCTPQFGVEVDVELDGISGLFEAYHDAERVAMAPSVNLRNIGNHDVAWYRPIEPDGRRDPAVVGPHPFLVMHIYRLADGVLRQIGRSDVKHAFFAANSGCACQGDQILFAGCSDLYSAVTNYNRINMAPRQEVTASTGAWQSSGSHFDGDPVDDFRHHQGEGIDHPDRFEHRLTARAADLLTVGAQYFIEAWYIVAEDDDIFNSMGHRGVTPTLSGSWTFPFTDSGVTQGPALDAWVDRAAPPPGTAATVLDTGEGHVELAVRATLLGSGLYRYEYALFNLDFDRQIRSLSIPLPPDVTVVNTGFDDVDDQPGNDWQSSVTASQIVWAMPDGIVGSGALDWGTLYNLRFEANAAPVDLMATLGVLEAGAPSELEPVSKGPGASLIPASRLDVTTGGSGSGSVTSDPAGIICASDCDELFATGSLVQLTAAADPGSAHLRWTEGGATVAATSGYDALLDMDRILEAVFELCDRELGGQTVATTELFEACELLTAGDGFEVAGTGVVTLRAGSRVVLADGFSVAPGGELVIDIAPSLLP